MKQLFHIRQENTNGDQHILSLRVGEQHVCFAISNGSGTEMYELAYCTGKWSRTELSDLYEKYPSLKRSFSECRIAYDYPHAVFIADGSGLHSELELTGFTNGLHFISEQVPDWQFRTQYAVPPDTRDWLMEKFPSATFRHEYTIGVKCIDLSGSYGTIMIDFRPDSFSSIVVKQGKFLLARHFTYDTPDDVLYYLIRTCQQFGLSQEDIKLRVSGLIDRHSSLFKELYQYFIDIQLRQPAWPHTPGEASGADCPPHFFTSLNDLARCAS